MRILWMTFGLTALALGFAGIALPLLPTVPFILLAAFCFGRSSERMHRWLHEHRVFGPMIDDWNTSGAIRRPAKIWATISIACVFLLSVILGVGWHVIAIQAAVLSLVLLFIWTRPG